jgi:hypothetical protein
MAFFVKVSSVDTIAKEDTSILKGLYLSYSFCIIFLGFNIYAKFQLFFIRFHFAFKLRIILII